MKPELSEHRALVTGASGGLGAAIVRRLATEGTEVVATGRRPEPLESIAAETGSEVCLCDLANRSSLEGLLETVASVDLFVCNAALPATGPLEDFSVDEIDRALDVDPRAPILLSRAAGPAMASRGGGHIVFVSSI
jgi:NAD(P)-dependent dehydrogenase (short-subunit alcohol dehydrogenase family)